MATSAHRARCGGAGPSLRRRPAPRLNLPFALAALLADPRGVASQNGLDTRSRILRRVLRYPGLHLSEIARAVGIEPNHAKYHLGRLEKAGLVSQRRETGFVRFFPRREGALGMQESLSPTEKDVVSLLRRRIPLHVVLLLLERGEAVHSELLREVDVAHPTLHYHLRALQDGGVVVPADDAGSTAYRLAEPDMVRDLLARFRPPDALVEGFLDAWEDLEL